MKKDFEKHNSKMIGLYNVLKKNMKSKFFFDAYLQISLTIMYFFSKLHVKLAVIE